MAASIRYWDLPARQDDALSILAGLDSAESGELWYNGELITEPAVLLPPQSDRHRFPAVQSHQYLTGIENVELAMTETDNPVPKNRREIAFCPAGKVGIVRSKAQRPIAKLSGGERRQIAIARALAANVDLIFADEPTGNLDTATEQEIIGSSASWLRISARPSSWSRIRKRFPNSAMNGSCWRTVQIASGCRPRPRKSTLKIAFDPPLRIWHCFTAAGCSLSDRFSGCRYVVKIVTKS